MLRLFTISMMALSMTACASWRHHRTPSEDTKVYLKDAKGNKKEAPAQATSSDSKERTQVAPSDEELNAAQNQAQEMKTAVAAAAEHIQNTHVESKPPQTPSRTAGTVPAEKAQGWLKNGNTRFVKGFFRNDGASAKDRLRLVHGQRPHSVIVASSDSRVPPEIIFDQKLGEVFVVRTATDSLDNGLVSSVDSAVQTLGTNLVVVLGNDSWNNVDGIYNDLVERSAVLRDAVASGEVKVVKAMYHLDSGYVEWR